MTQAPYTRGRSSWSVVKKTLVAALAVTALAASPSAASAHLDAGNARNQCQKDLQADAAHNNVPIFGWITDWHVYGDRDIAVRVFWHNASWDAIRIYDCRYIGDNGWAPTYGVINTSFEWRYAPYGPGNTAILGAECKTTYRTTDGC